MYRRAPARPQARAAGVGALGFELVQLIAEVRERLVRVAVVMSCLEKFFARMKLLHFVK